MNDAIQNEVRTPSTPFFHLRCNLIVLQTPMTSASVFVHENNTFQTSFVPRSKVHITMNGEMMPFEELIVAQMRLSYLPTGSRAGLVVLRGI